MPLPITCAVASLVERMCLEVLVICACGRGEDEVVGIVIPLSATTLGLIPFRSTGGAEGVLSDGVVFTAFVAISSGDSMPLLLLLTDREYIASASHPLMTITAAKITQCFRSNTDSE